MSALNWNGMPAQLILASSSPRRREVLTEADIAFTMDAADMPEVAYPEEMPLHFARRLAREKALSVVARHQNDYILGADTIVLVEHEVLGKPADAADAARMLRLLSGRPHNVITAVCVVPPTSSSVPWPDVRHATTRVDFRKITEQEIADYTASGEPMDKAGAYAIQGGAAVFVTHYDGDYNNVVGLPLALTRAMLKENGAAF